MMLLLCVLLVLNLHITILLGKSSKCQQDWKWKCPSEDKCISKSLLCDGIPQCINGEDEDHCSLKFCEEYFEFPKWKCPGNQTKCIVKAKVCDGRHDCEQGKDEGEICTPDFCEKLGRYLCPKSDGNICTKKENICRNCYQSYYCNAYTCTEEFCENTLEKMACSDGKQCIDKRFACDGQGCDCHCLNSCECESCNDRYEDSEAFCKDFCKEKNMLACPYKKQNKVFARCSLNCHVSSFIANISSLVKQEVLWKCPHETILQYIEKDKLCDGIPQCTHGQDESVVICGTLTIYSVLAITATFVIFGAISVYLARKTQLIPLKCCKCDKLYRRRVKMKYKAWKMRLRFLSYILELQCPELNNHKMEAKTHNENQLQTVYKSIHRDNLSDVYFYIVHRIESMFTLTTFSEAIQRKHLIMKTLYELEMSVHDNDHKSVVKCLKSKIGASAETDAILDFRNPPSMWKKIITFFTVAIKRISVFRIVITFIKVITLTFDIIRDYILLYEMGRMVVNSYDGTGDYVTANDFIILFSFIAASFYAHIFIGVYVYHNRYIVLSTCSHDTSQKTEFILLGLCTIAFPLLGAATVTINYLEQFNLENEFKAIQDGEWNGKKISRKKFQDIIIQKYRIKDLIVAGFPTIKVIESTLESYYQILIVLILLFKDPYDGVLNQQIIGMGIQARSIKRIVFFVGSSGLTFMFLVWSVVDFISKHQGDSINFVGKVILLLIYTLQLSLGLLTTLVTTFSRFDYGDLFPLFLNMAMMISKTILLILYAIFHSSLRNSLSSMAMFVLPNTVTPIPFGPLRGTGIANIDKVGILNKLRLDELKILWILLYCEIIIRGILITVFSSNEALSPLNLTKQYIWIIILLVLGSILVLWKLFFQFTYLFRDILYDNGNTGSISVDTEFGEIQQCEGIPLQDNVQRSRENLSRKYIKTKSPFSFLVTLISVLGIIITIVICYPSIRVQNHVYKDCGEVFTQKLDNGIYSIWKDDNHTSTLFTMCVDGKTLIQKTDPDGGNKRLFFQRPMKEYENGFGSTSRDYFMGLDTISNLVTLGNTVLTLDAVMHNGSNIEISFSNLRIQKKIMDIYPYFGTHLTNKTIHYAISYDEPNHGYILIRPNYMKSIENKTESSQFFRYEDYHFAGFTASDNEDNICGHQFKSGWWFPLRYSRYISDQPFCAHNPFLQAHNTSKSSSNIDLSTNLNGVYREDEEKSERTIVFCDNKPHSECFKRQRGDGLYSFTGGTIIKLKSTRLFLSK